MLKTVLFLRGIAFQDSCSFDLARLDLAPRKSHVPNVPRKPLFSCPPSIAFQPVTMCSVASWQQEQALKAGTLSLIIQNEVCQGACSAGLHLSKSTWVPPSEEGSSAPSGNLAVDPGTAGQWPRSAKKEDAFADFYF